MSESDAPIADEPSKIDRRAAIKKAAVGAAAAGVVWSAPKIEGLTLRPNYAAAQSGGVGTFTVNQAVSLGARENIVLPCGDGNWSAAVNLPGPTNSVADSILYNGTGTANFTCAITTPMTWSVGSSSASFCDASGPATNSVTWQFVVTCT